MFFTSYEFLFVYLPVVWAGFAVIRGLDHPRAASGWLILTSLVFYGSLDMQHLPHLMGTIAVNYLTAIGIRRLRQGDGAQARSLMWAGVSFNIALLVWFKYFTTGASIPLGISFYTIQLIAFLVAVYNEDGTELPLHRFVLFASFFPYVVAGPVVTKNEVFDQLGGITVKRATAMLLPALTLFAIGLFKKVVFADQIGEHVNTVYGAASRNAPLSMSDAWAAALLYTLQIYFDFSGYSDMAAGLAGAFGVRLPRNFHSPLKATSIMEFWRRWHMSATRFFTNHFYLPVVVKAMRLAVRWRLQGMSRFLFTVVAPMLVTFLLIGTWHGAGMTAVAFGLLMGAAISVNHLWIKLSLPSLPPWAGWLLTAIVVVAGMVLSRADNMQVAASLFAGMLGLHDQAASLLDPWVVASWITALGAVVLLMPNSNQILDRYPVVLSETWDKLAKWQEAMTWQYGINGTLVTSAIFSAAAVLIPKAAQFIYYRF